MSNVEYGDAAQAETVIPDDQISVVQAMRVLSAAMKTDPDYAWSWHCNLAMAMYDQGCDPVQANKGAASFMATCFDLDTKLNPHYQSCITNWQETTEKGEDMSENKLPQTGEELHKFAAENGIDAVKKLLRDWVDNGQGDELMPGYTSRAMCRIASSGLEGVEDNMYERPYLNTKYGTELYFHMCVEDDL